MAPRKNGFDVQSPVYAAWRKKVYKRDKYTCRMCRARGVYFNAHHIKRKAVFPELAFKVGNGITLCKKCHNTVTRSEEMFEKLFKKIVHNKIKNPCRILRILKASKVIDKRKLRGVYKRLLKAIKKHKENRRKKDE